MVAHVCSFPDAKSCGSPLRNALFHEYPSDNQSYAILIGGGITGIVAATMLKERGHEPVLIEKTEKPGGQFSIAGESPGKAEFKEAIRNRGGMP